MTDVGVALVFSHLDSFPGDFYGGSLDLSGFDLLGTNGWMDRWMDGWTDRQTDRASYGDAGSHLKRTK